MADPGPYSKAVLWLTIAKLVQCLDLLIEADFSEGDVSSRQSRGSAAHLTHTQLQWCTGPQCEVMLQFTRNVAD